MARRASGMTAQQRRVYNTQRGRASGGASGGGVSTGGGSSNDQA